MHFIGPLMTRRKFVCICSSPWMGSTTVGRAISVCMVPVYPKCPKTWFGRWVLFLQPPIHHKPLCIQMLQQFEWLNLQALSVPNIFAICPKANQVLFAFDTPRDIEKRVARGGGGGGVVPAP